MAIELPSWAIVSPGRRAHIERVVALADRWAAALEVSPAEAERWHRAATLHDALRDAGPAELARYTPQDHWPAALWHGPAAAAAAQRHGEADRGVLDAVRYHSVGCAGWDDAGRIVFLADYLEEGRRHHAERRAERAERVPRDLPGVLVDVAAERFGWLLEQRKPLMRESWEFWNQIVADASSSSS